MPACSGSERTGEVVQEWAGTGPLSTLGRDDAVVRALDAPVEGLASTVGVWREPALLESGPEFGDAGRWSVLAARPRGAFEAVGENWSWRDAHGRREAGRAAPLNALAAVLGRFGLAERAGPSGDRTAGDGPPFQGGMIGHIGYDFAPRLERLPRRAPRDSRMPDVRMALYDTAVMVDHATGTASVWAWDLTGEGRRAAERRAERWQARIERTAMAGFEGAERPRRGPVCASVGQEQTASERAHRRGPSSEMPRDAYLARARRVLEYIAAGDVFQVNLSQRFASEGPYDPLEVYLRLKRTSPAPFAAFLQWGDDLAIVSASPEWFYQTRGDWIATRPIKGTRPRGRSPEEDARLAAELLEAPKDRAELTMIVDLERNDLGRVCQFGTIGVRGPLRVETFAQVHHLVATVEGQLRPDAGPCDIVRAMFPGGSITGAPKIRAMQIIDELEPNRRSVYTGAIGYFSRGGASAFNIAIRTILFEGGRARYQVGGGIVADSDPEAEYEETLAKGLALRRALEDQEQFS